MKARKPAKTKSQSQSQGHLEWKGFSTSEHRLTRTTFKTSRKMGKELTHSRGKKVASGHYALPDAVS
jgi:hypothetical protein